MDDGTCVPEDCAEFGEWVDSQLYSVLQSTREYSWMVHFDTRITFDEFGGNDDDEVVLAPYLTLVRFVQTMSVGRFMKRLRKI